MSETAVLERLVTEGSISLMTNCSVDLCSRQVQAKGMCPAHYQRARQGRPIDVVISDYMVNPNDTLLDRLAPRLAYDGEHLLWQSACIPQGYGVFQYKGIMWLAHRAAYTIAYGPIPDGLHLDHEPACPKNCVMPDHLTAMTQAEHNRLTMSRPEEGLRNRQSAQGECSVDGCDTKIRARRLCIKHYTKFRKLGVF